LKKLLLLACLAGALLPSGAKAEDHDREDHPKHHMRVNEMTGIGISAAALVGVAGYFLLRRRPLHLV